MALMEPAPMARAEAGDGLSWEARLVHSEPGRRVVEASAWQQGQCLGRSLGEAEAAEAAEDRAIARLQQRLWGAGTPRERPAPVLIRHASAEHHPAEQRPTEPTPAQPVPQAPVSSEGQSEGAHTPEPQLHAPEELHTPDDWSEELAELDVQLQRLGWDRAQEGVYLQRAFAHPSRSRLTSYTDLAAYLRCLRDLPAGCCPEQAPVPLRRRDLLAQSDALLASLGWDAARGRTLLEGEFQRTSRQQLSDEQLLHFNMLLETELIAAGSGPSPAANPG